MAETTPSQPDDVSAESAGQSPASGHVQHDAARIDQGAYEVIRRRLDSHGRTLRDRLNQLNARRKEVFGSIEFKLTDSDRITTANNCIPRDIVAVGGRFLMGFNVHFGLKTHIELSDVFAAYRLEDGTFHEEDLSLLQGDAFVKDFTDLFRFYKNATFAKFFRDGPHIYMKFRVGRDIDDFKSFKWAVQGDTLVYQGNRSDHEVRYPQQHEFVWKRATREMQTQGAFPHYSIDDVVFVETTGGDLTIKVENNTDTGDGIYAEPVDNPDQALDDAEVHYVRVGHLVLLKVRPYQEQAYRYFIYNAKLQEVIREDSIGKACLLLPENHGLIFAHGYYLASGRYQRFPNLPESLLFERRIASPNGEDFAYIFYNREVGEYVIMAYNLIEQTVQTPLVSNGYAFFGDGRMIFFKAPEHGEPQKHHAVQVWQTPFVGPDHVTSTESDSFLYKIGNRDVVRGMAECVEVLDLISREDLYADLYVDLVKTTSDLLDAYFWLDNDEAANLAEPLRQIRSAAQAAVGEYEKVTRIQRDTRRQIAAVSREVNDLVNRNAARIYDNILVFVEALAALREVRGRVIALRELRYVDLEEVDELETAVREQSESLSERCVAYLLEPQSLDPYRQAAREHDEKIDSLTKATEARELAQAVRKSADELEMLIEIVSNLRIDDTTQRTTIVDNISEIFSDLNATRSRLRNKQQELGRNEGVAEFNSQLKLLNQSVANYLDLSDEPEKADQYLTRVMVQLEELEGRFAEFDEFVLQLTEKREEIYNAFENRKLQLVERRNKRAEALGQAAGRILSSIRSRVAGMDEIVAINSYFASDLLIDKIRDICEELGALNDTVRVDDIQSRLKTIREDAVRQLKDRLDLQEGGKNTIRFGRHVFSVNTQPIDLTVVTRNDQMQLHLTGTQFFEPIDDETLNASRDVWTQEVVSEDATVYRGEYLAYLMRQELADLEPAQIEALLTDDEEVLVERVRQFMSPRYSEGYTKGVHDVDGAKLLRELLRMDITIGLLRYRPSARALASVFWQIMTDGEHKKALAAYADGMGKARLLFTGRFRDDRLVRELTPLIAEFATRHNLFDPALASEAATYLDEELAGGEKGFAVSPDAARLVEAFTGDLKANRKATAFDEAVAALDGHPRRQFALIRDWLRAFVATVDPQEQQSYQPYIDEAAARVAEGGVKPTRIVPVSTRTVVEGLVGSHPTITDGKLLLDYNAFMARLRHFATVKAPAFEAFTRAKHAAVERARRDMRIEEFTPKVLTSFVRNKLIDQVFLPLIGDNLAKQMGTTGAGTRTDRNGLLLLISPPGYGKTTLMEYIASRLGVIFMKINGPAIGHNVTSIDPAEATNAAAREELEKLNLAFEMGDNVMIYVDDIQHTSAEFLQKFISLCDAQRRIEGIYKGRTRTYDFRGRKVAIVMAGNPYTESGEQFKIPDMLANRADTYNLGDIIGDHGDAFKMSYLENCLTSNPALNPLATRSQADVYSIIRIAETGSREGIEFEGNYSREDVDEMVEVMRKLIAVRDVILKVNLQYIASAGQEDQYRTEPPFLLQGSYRNMNRIAEKVQPVMNDAELRTLILASYEQDAQTLTTGAEANLLKFREMMGWITDEEKARWEDIKRTFVRNNSVRALGGDDRTAAVLTQMAGLNQNLGDIHGALAKGLASLQSDNGKRADEPAVAPIDLTPLAEHLAAFAETMTGIRDAMITLATRPTNNGEAEGNGKRGKAKPIEARLDEATLEALRDVARELASRPAAPPPALSAPRKPAAAPAEAEPSRPVPAGRPSIDTASPGSPFEIRVVNKVPATFLYVMKEQFELMKAWMEPLGRLAASHEGPAQQIQASLQAITMRYDDIIQRLEKNQIDTGDSADTED